MTERFSGRITLEEGDEVDVDLELSDEEVRLATESADVGVWPRSECEIRDVGDGVYLLVVDDDVVTFVPAESNEFGKALLGSNGAGPAGESGVTADLADPVAAAGYLSPVDDDDDGFFISVEPSPSDEEPVPDASNDVGEWSAGVTGSQPGQDSSFAEGEDSTGADLLDGVREGGELIADGVAEEAAGVGGELPDAEVDVDVEPNGAEGEEAAVDGVESGFDTAVDSSEEGGFLVVDELPETPVDSWAGLTTAGEDLEAEESHDEPQSFFDTSAEDDAAQPFESVPVADAAGSAEQAWMPETDEEIDYEVLAAALEELAEEQAVEIEEEPDLDKEEEAAEAAEVVDEPKSKPRARWFRRRTGDAKEVEAEEAAEAQEAAEAAAVDAAAETDTPAEEPDERTRGWFQDPSPADVEPAGAEEPTGEADNGPKVRSSTERLAAAVGALKEQRSLTPAEQAIAEAEAQAQSVISTDEVIESQRSLRKTNVVRRLTWDLVRKVGAGVLLGLGIAVLVFLFPNAWDVLTRDSDPTVVVEDAPTSTTIDDVATPATTIGTTTSTAPQASSTTSTTLPAVDSVFDLSSQDFFARWNEAAVPIDRVLAFAVFPPPGEFENEFYPYLSMTGTIDVSGSIREFAIVVDPTGPSDADWLAIQALGVAIAVVEPPLTGQERAELLGSLGLDVRQPDLAGIDAALVRRPHRYELSFDAETTLLTLRVSPAGITLP